MPAIGRQPTTAPKQQLKPTSRGLPVESKAAEVKVQDWLNPINKTILIAAFRARSKVVTLNDREFVIDYNKRNGYAWVHPKAGQNVPCGWFELDRSTSKDFFNG